jgi:hypothetical protein
MKGGAPTTSTALALDLTTFAAAAARLGISAVASNGITFSLPLAVAAPGATARPEVPITML